MIVLKYYNSTHGCTHSQGNCLIAFDSRASVGRRLRVRLGTMRWDGNPTSGSGMEMSEVCLLVLFPHFVVDVKLVVSLAHEQLFISRDVTGHC